MSLFASMCRYFLWNTYKYLLMYVSLSFGILLKIPTNTPSHRRHASPPHYHRIAIASPQRIGAASRRCTKCRRLVDFIRITQDSHLPVVPLPTRCTRKKWILSKFSSGLWPSGQSDDEDTCRSHGRKVVTRWCSKCYQRCPIRKGVLCWSTAQHNQRKKRKESNRDMQNTSAINLNWRIRRTDRMAGVDPAQTMPDAKKLNSSSWINKKWKNIYQIMNIFIVQGCCIMLWCKCQVLVPVHSKKIQHGNRQVGSTVEHRF